MVLEYIKRISYFIIFYLLILFILSIFNYYSFVDDKMFSFLELFVLLVNILIQSFYLGRKSSNKGYLEGIKIGLFIIIIFIIYTLIYSSFHLFLLLYYIMIMSISILGSIIGINTKKRKESS